MRVVVTPILKYNKVCTIMDVRLTTLLGTKCT